VSVTENFGKFLDLTGLQAGHIAWWLANVPWPSDAARDDFIARLSAPPPPGA
jgi:hypothetical protein